MATRQEIAQRKTRLRSELLRARSTGLHSGSLLPPVRERAAYVGADPGMVCTMPSSVNLRSSWRTTPMDSWYRSARRSR